MNVAFDGEIPVEISNRHVHLSQADQDALFGPGYRMKVRKPLSQKDQWAAEETVTVIGPKGEMDMRVLGPCRKATQVEIARTDAVKLGIEAVERLSGDHEGTTGCKIRGPQGEIEIAAGVIVALRHIHVSDAEAAVMGLKHGEAVSVGIQGPRAVTLHEVHVRVDPSYRLNMHLDTDEGNAAGIPRGGTGRLLMVS